MNGIYGQRPIAEDFFNEPIEDWWEPGMKKADEILDDEELHISSLKSFTAALG